MPSPETSRRNLEKAKANWRPPLPWRSSQETRLIKALAWRWYRIKEPRCGVRQIARYLGVSHTYVQKLVREFAGDTRNAVQQQRAYGLATFADLRCAQEETAQLRTCGRLRRSSVSRSSVAFEHAMLATTPRMLLDKCGNALRLSTDAKTGVAARRQSGK